MHIMFSGNQEGWLTTWSTPPPPRSAPAKVGPFFFTGGLILDSDDDLSLGTDARVFSTSGSEAPLVSPGSSSQSTQ